MIANHFALIADINHVERVQSVLIINVHAVGTVLQNINYTCRGIFRCGCDRMESERGFINLRMILDILKQIQTKLVQSQVHNGNAGRHIFNINYFFLQAFQLCFTIFKVSLFFFTQKVVVAGCCHINDLHTGFDLCFQVNIFVKRYIRPEIHKLNISVLTTDTVDTTKTLNDTNRIPMNIIVYKIIAILQVLTFRDTVRCNQ